MSTNTPNEKGTPQSRTYTVNDIASILGIGRTSAYKLANSGAFKTIRIGNMIRISRKSFEDRLKMEEPSAKWICKTVIGFLPFVELIHIWVPLSRFKTQVSYIATFQKRQTGYFRFLPGAFHDVSSSAMERL